jgi:hypothetical protein
MRVQHMRQQALTDSLPCQLLPPLPQVRLVTESGLRDLVQRLHKTMQKHGNATLPKT